MSHEFEQEMDRDAQGLVQPILGKGDLTLDAWGRQKVVLDYSILHGMFTFNVPDVYWLEFFNGVERVKTNATSVGGALNLVSGTGVTYLRTKRFPRYQPNRGLIYSSSVFIPNAIRGTGNLYGVVRKNGVDTKHLLVTDGEFTDFNASKGNTYDIQMQWRGVGDVTFNVSGKTLMIVKNLGKLSSLSVNNPAMPIAYECSNLGIVRWGTFTAENGVFFEWTFNSPQVTSLLSGCCDISSEGGAREFSQYISTATPTNSGSIPIVGFNAPVIAVRIPTTFNGSLNTIDVLLSRITGYSDNKSVMRVWSTRDLSAIIGGSWVTMNGGNIECNHSVTSVDIGKLNLWVNRRVNVDSSETITNPNTDGGDVYLTNGDYTVVTIHRENGGTANVGASIEMFECI